MAAAEAVPAEREVEYGFEAGAIGEVLAPVRPTALVRELPAFAAAPLLSALSAVLFFDEAAVFDEARAWAEACRRPRAKAAPAMGRTGKPAVDGPVSDGPRRPDGPGGGPAVGRFIRRQVGY